MQSCSHRNSPSSFLFSVKLVGVTSTEVVVGVAAIVGVAVEADPEVVSSSFVLLRAGEQLIIITGL